MKQTNGAEPPVAAAVRMYKDILGDCFLLTLEEKGRTSRILIDCGVLQGVAGAREKMRLVAADLVEACGGSVAEKRPGRLDLLVVTHEHWDHISGFSYAPDIFFGEDRLLRIGELWYAWTEKPTDKQAIRLRERFAKKKKAVSMAAAGSAAGPGSPFAAAPAAADRGLGDFIGPLDEGGLGAAGGAPRTGRAILDALRDAADKVRYLEPGDTRATPGGPSVHTYVLGPPRREEYLFRDLPVKGPGRETYLDSAANGGAAIEELAENPQTDLTGHSPFARPHRTLDAAWRHEMKRESKRRAPRASEAELKVYKWIDRLYFAPRTGCRFGEAPAPPGHDCDVDVECEEDQSYRRIDGDWLAAAGPLAMKLDSDTNNTSLVLAFELPGDDRDVLLFAADAQVGNWLSWHLQDYKAPGGGRVTAEEILGRTVLYKVGHHGSHNATLNQQGLAMMKSPRLVAMIPTVEAIAKQQGSKGWEMPFPHLKTELLVRTRGRLLRGDAAPGKDADGTTITRDDDFVRKRVKTGPNGLWVEYRVAG